ncbi:mtDNA inheritance, partitioning of the mitochondrial organelle [Saxophila tyrrhenica]|uniref:MtDNA inheritance, partitioning of the mitochondrial organelle n=1 Tax=Saxophila tyrrhenica TaxID=1690608 RepID=A0AAV9NWZ1_9PEZI|nr:mtDNA inheritance, partitioning of the mitochondrial organelle [Saxophila tyrrhenica]
MHEVVTLQFGQRANYLATHYWNIQESYFTYPGQPDSPVDHDISFRPGIGADGSDTYTPRTLIYDLKGGFGTLRRENALYELQQQDDATHQGQWGGRTASLQLPPIAPSPYQQALDQGTQPPQLSTDTVRFWSDYNHIFYHPRSIVQVNEYELNSSLMPFERWETGQELFRDLDREHDLLDRDLRPLLEECDQLQGLQILSSTDDAWGGFTSRYLERISDELGKGCRWVFGLKEGNERRRERQMLQMANFAQSLYALDSHASVHVPLSMQAAGLPSYVSADASSLWHTSALEAALMESVTLPTRLRGDEAARASFDTLETTLNNDGNRRIATAGFSVKDPESLQPTANGTAPQDSRMTNGVTHEDEEDEISTTDINLFPTTSPASRRLGSRPHTFSQVESLRGSWKGQDEIEDSNAASRDRFAEGPRVSIHQSQLLFPILSSYPEVLRFQGHPKSLAVKAQLSTSTKVANGVRDVERSARSLIGIDEREAICDGLSSIAEECEEGWDPSDDDDDND